MPVNVPAYDCIIYVTIAYTRYISLWSGYYMDKYWVLFTGVKDSRLNINGKIQ